MISRDVINDANMLGMIDSVVGNLLLEHAEKHL
eukprot:COSAG05_NODE_16676_length_341_cov_0.636364_1_plen_32_part_01